MSSLFTEFGYDYKLILILILLIKFSRFSSMHLAEFPKFQSQKHINTLKEIKMKKERHMRNYHYNKKMIICEQIMSLTEIMNKLINFTFLQNVNGQNDQIPEKTFQNVSIYKNKTPSNQKQKISYKLQDYVQSIVKSEILETYDEVEKPKYKDKQKNSMQNPNKFDQELYYLIKKVLQQNYNLLSKFGSSLSFNQEKQAGKKNVDNSQKTDDSSNQSCTMKSQSKFVTRKRFQELQVVTSMEKSQLQSYFQLSQIEERKKIGRHRRFMSSNLDSPIKLLKLNQNNSISGLFKNRLGSESILDSKYLQNNNQKQIFQSANIYEGPLIRINKSKIATSYVNGFI